MHQFKICYTDYTKEGAPTNNTHFAYCDTAEQAKNKYDELNKLYYEYTNEETGEVHRYKAYKVELKVAAYKKIDDPAAFFAQFEI